MSTQGIIALVIFLFPLAYSPGPGNIFFAINGARFGFLSTIGLTLGYHIATLVVTLAIGFGFLSLLNQFPDVFLVIKIAGAGYVLWLAWNLFRAGILTDQQQPKAAGFMDGVILLLFNPKAYFIIAVMFSQFLKNTPENNTALIVWISIIFTLNNLLAFSIWTVLGDSLARLFRNELMSRKLNTAFGLMLAIVAVWMLFI